MSGQKLHKRTSKYGIKFPAGRGNTLGAMLNRAIKDEDDARIEYQKLELALRRSGFEDPAVNVQLIRDDEIRHAKQLRLIKMSLRAHGVRV